MKKYSWIISFALAISALVWPVLAINSRIVAVESLYKDSDTISRTIETCGNAAVSEMPFGNANIGWKEFCGLIENDSQVNYYLEQDRNDRDGITVYALTVTDTGFVLITSNKTKVSFLESVTSFGVKGNTIFYTTKRVNGLVDALGFLTFMVLLLMWLLLYWIVSPITERLDKATYSRLANAKTRGMEN